MLLHLLTNYSELMEYILIFKDNYKTNALLITTSVQRTSRTTSGTHVNASRKLDLRIPTCVDVYKINNI